MWGWKWWKYFSNSEKFFNHFALLYNVHLVLCFYIACNLHTSDLPFCVETPTLFQVSGHLFLQKIS